MYIRHTFDRACEAAAMTDFHFHDLRHTFASWLVIKGVPLATVSTLLASLILFLIRRTGSA